MYKITYYFADTVSTASAGWTETFYLDGSATAAAALANATVPSFIGARLSSLASTYSLVRVRSVRAPDNTLPQGNRADSAEVRQLSTFWQGQANTGGGHAVLLTSEPPWDALLIRFVAGTISVRNFPLRGIPETAFLSGSNASDAAAISAAVRRFIAQCSQPGNSFQIRKALLQGTPANVPAGGCTVGPDQRSLIINYTGGTTPTYPLRALISVKGVLNAGPANHLWRIQTFTGGILTTYPGRRQILGTPTGAITTQQILPGYNAITAGTVVRGMHRNTGRPSVALRGRALVRTR